MRGPRLTPVHQTILLVVLCDLILLIPLAGVPFGKPVHLESAVTAGACLPILILVASVSAVRICIRSRMAALACFTLAVLHAAFLGALTPATDYFGEGLYTGLPAVGWGLASLVVTTAGIVGWINPYDQNPAASFPVCVRCRYNLTGNLSGVCPECGTPIAGRKPQT